ncbi:hypothetical protein JXB12_02670 [candidate division KSB1 bacterium]|nr:hypothetical protein [candidate division KSB1 bacterium]
MKLMCRIFIISLISVQIHTVLKTEHIYAGTMHSVGGSVRNSLGGIPAVGSLTFEAFITTRTNEILTQSSAGCNYYAAGYFQVQCASFPTDWSPSEICRIEFHDQNSGETGSVEVELTVSEGDNAGTVYLSGGVEVVSVPAVPTGPASGYVSQSLNFSTSGSVCNYSHPVEYQFDFGNGVQSSWSSSGTASYAYNSSGTFLVKARARCQVNTGVISGWSDSKTVSVAYCVLTTDVSPVNVGQVTRDPDKTGYSYNEPVELDAVATDGRYRFSYWTGDMSGSANPQSINMTGDKTVTAVFIKETVSTPGKPTGPSNGMVQQSLNFSVTGSSSSFGHPIQYRFDFGDGNYSNWGSGSQSHIYSSGGTFNVKAQARCQTHTDIVSAWSSGLSVTISAYTLSVTIDPSGSGSVAQDPNKQEYNPNETVELTASPVDGSFRFKQWSGDLSGNQNPTDIVMDSPKQVTVHFEIETISRPSIPNGPSTAYTGQPVTFTCAGAVSSFGHSLYYRLNWGDGVTSGWGGAAQTHSYQTPGDYHVLAQARCIQHGAIVSEWSDLVSITIRSLSLSVTIDPPNSGTVLKNPDKNDFDFDENVSLTARGTPIYDFDYWSGDATGADETIQLKMDSNKSITAHFRLIDEIVSAPDIPSGPASGIMGEEINFNATGAVSNLGHSVDYQFDWGDGTSSDWGSGSRSHTYLQQGIVHVSARARCADHPDVMSAWSTPLTVTIGGYHLSTGVLPADAGSVVRIPDKDDYHSGEQVSLIAIPEPLHVFDSWSGDVSGINDTLDIIMDSDKNVIANFDVVDETVSVPDSLTGPNSGLIGENLQFHVSGSMSNLGHRVEYQFDWGDGKTSTWCDGECEHSYARSGQFEVKARARCRDHTTIQSAWSSTHDVEIKGCKLIVSVNPEGSGTVEIEPDSAEFAVDDMVTLTARPAVTYQFDFWSGDQVDTCEIIQVVMTSDKHVIANFSRVPEVVSVPNKPAASGKGFMGEEVIVLTGGSSSNLGHDIEYQFNFGDGKRSDWGAPEAAHTYHLAGEMAVTAHARCVEHAEIESAWSDTLWLTIEGYSLFISVAPESSGTVRITPHAPTYSSGDTVNLYAEPYPFYLFDRWEGDIISTNDSIKVVMDSDKTLIAYFVGVEVVSKPDLIYGVSKAFRKQSVTFKAEGAVSNKNHEIEYQFDWGDGTLSPWGIETSQIAHNITVYTSPSGGSGLPNSGKLVDAATGATCNAALRISGGRYDSHEHSTSGSDVKAGTDAFVIFNGRVGVQGALFGAEPADEPLLLTISGLDESKRYDVVLYADLGESGWNRISIIGLEDTRFFINESSYGLDDEGNPLFSGEGDGTTILPAGNSEHGYVARFNRVDPGPDGIIVVRIQGFDRAENRSRAGFVNALMLREIDYRNDELYFTSYNDLAWYDSIRTHQYHTDGTYSVSARARCKEHPDITSEYSEPFDIKIKGCRLDIHKVPENNQCLIVRYPDEIDYDYNSRIQLHAQHAMSFGFLNWNNNLADRDTIKIIHISRDTVMIANFEILADMLHESEDSPKTYQLYQNFPNPFNPETRIDYDLPRDCVVKFTIYNSLGQTVCRLKDEFQLKGHYSINWDATDDKGHRVDSGIYFGILKTDDVKKAIKITLLK